MLSTMTRFCFTLSVTECVRACIRLRAGAREILVFTFVFALFSLGTCLLANDGCSWDSAPKGWEGGGGKAWRGGCSQQARLAKMNQMRLLLTINLSSSKLQNVTYIKLYKRTSLVALCLLYLEGTARL